MTEEHATDSIDILIATLNYNKKYDVMSVDQKLLDALTIVNTLAKKEHIHNLSNKIIKEMKS